MTLLAFIVVYIYYKNVNVDGEGKTFGQGMERICKGGIQCPPSDINFNCNRFLDNTASVICDDAEIRFTNRRRHASPEWIANVNPFVVMISVVFITNLMKNVRAVSSMTVGMFLMPLSALLMASSPVLESLTGQSVSIFGFFSAHPVTVMMIAGIVVQGLAECFISPRYLEYFSFQAPKGEEGLYLGFSHLHSFLSSILGFGISGYLLTAYAPDPEFLTPEQMLHAYDHAHYIWYYFAVIGITAAVALLFYRWILDRSAAPRGGLV